MKHSPILFYITCLVVLVGTLIYFDNLDRAAKVNKPVKPKEPTIESTIRLKESGCTYLVFSNGQIVPEYGVDGKVVGCGE